MTFRRLACWDIISSSVEETEGKESVLDQDFALRLKGIQTLENQRSSLCYLVWVKISCAVGGVLVFCDHQDVPNHPLAAYDFMGRRLTLHGTLLCCLLGSVQGIRTLRFLRSSSTSMPNFYHHSARERERDPVPV